MHQSKALHFIYVLYFFLTANNQPTSQESWVQYLQGESEFSVELQWAQYQDKIIMNLV